jgi:DNA-directed RNA polymerase specialized sigma24 family protein
VSGRQPIDHPDDDFCLFVETAEPRLRRALVAAYGSDRGREATAEALAYAWEHWDRIREQVNVVGYLYRVGQSRTRSRKHRTLFARSSESGYWYEPELVPALGRLSESQRTAVVLVHGFGWTMQEVAELTGVKVTTIQNHLERGLKKLRTALKVATDG